MTSDFYDQILRQGASSETFRIVLAELKKEGNPRKVIQECTRALQIYPQDPFLRKLLAESCLEAGFIMQAEMELEKLTSRIDQLVPVYKMLAETYRRQRRGEDAIRALRIYLAHRPEDHEALDAFEALQVRQERMEEAGTAEEPGLREEAALSQIATPTLAEVYVAQGDLEEALNIYRKFIADNPDDERSRKRIQELELLLTAEESPGREKETGMERKKKERAVAILEAWLSDLRKMHSATAG